MAARLRFMLHVTNCYTVIGDLAYTHIDCARLTYLHVYRGENNLRLSLNLVFCNSQQQFPAISFPSVSGVARQRTFVI